MKFGQRAFRLQLSLILGLICLLFAGLAMPALAELPPRPTPVIQKPSDEPNRPVGAEIALSVIPAQSGLWSVVEWQDANGDWQQVESWQGTLDAGQKIWWVAQKDFGTGPFRWAVYQSAGGELLGASDPFMLPAEANGPANVIVVLE